MRRRGRRSFRRGRRSFRRGRRSSRRSGGRSAVGIRM